MIAVVDGGAAMCLLSPALMLIVNTGVAQRPFPSASHDTYTAALPLLKDELHKKIAVGLVYRSPHRKQR